MVDLVSGSNNGGNAGDGFEAIASLNDGFLGTGYSTGVELSLIVLALIAGYVGMSLFRYYLPEIRILHSVASALGLRGN